MDSVKRQRASRPSSSVHAPLRSLTCVTVAPLSAPDMDANKVDPIPDHFNNAEEAGEVWDTHSAAGHWDEMEESEMKFDIQERVFWVTVDLPCGVHPKMASYHAPGHPRRGRRIYLPGGIYLVHGLL